MKHFILSLGINLLTCAISFSLHAQEKLPPYRHQSSRSAHLTNSFDAVRNAWPPINSQSSVADTGFSTLGLWTWGPCLAVELTGNYALVGQGQNYQVLDISDLSHPRLLYDTTMENGVPYIKIIDTVLFVVLDHTVLFCDARQLYPLREYGRFEISPTQPIGFREISVSDSLMFITGMAFGMIAVNISDLQHPVFRGGIGLWWFPYDNPVAARGQYIYYGPQGPGWGLFIFLWTPDSAFGQVWKQLYVRGTAMSIFLRDSLLFVGSSQGRLSVFTISDPWNPQALDSLELASEIFQIVSKGNNLYCSTRDSGIVVLNIADPSHLSIVGHAPRMNVVAFRSAVSDSVLGVAEYIGVEFYSIAQTDSIDKVTFSPSGGEYYGIAKRGNIVYLASAYAGLWSVDFADARYPRAVANILTPDYSLDVVLTGDVACVLAKRDRYPFHDSVLVIQIDNSGTLTRLSSFPTDLNATSIVVRDSLVVVGADSAVGIFSIADPLHPYRLSTWRQPGIYLSVSVSGNILAVGSRVWDAGLRLLDISDPSSPQLLSYLPMDAIGILLQDSLAFVGQPYLEILNISNPSLPSVISSSTIPCGSSVKFLRNGNTLYKTGDYVGVVDISRLDQPFEITTFLYWSFPYGLAASNDTLFVATSASGVWALKNNFVMSVDDNDLKIPVGFALFDNYPNPFNPSTVIRYQLPVKSLVILKVFDVLGQEVATLVTENKPAGTYEVKWDATQVPSGVYFYRLTTGHNAITRKMLLIR